MKKINVKGSKFKAQVSKSKFINLNLNNKLIKPDLGVMINLWGINERDQKKSKIFAEIQEKSNHLKFYVKSLKIDCPHWICGYPSIKLGEGIWYPKTKIILEKPKDYKKMKVSGKFDFKVKGFGNFSLDAWLTKKSDSTKIEKEDIEIMVWFDKNFDLPYPTIGEIPDFEVKYVKKTDKDLNQHWFIFFPKKKTKEFIFDLKNLINFCKKKVKNIDNYYIRSIDLGIEFTQKTEIEAKLYKLNFDFDLK